MLAYNTAAFLIQKDVYETAKPVDLGERASFKKRTALSAIKGPSDLIGQGALDVVILFIEKVNSKGGEADIFASRDVPSLDTIPSGVMLGRSSWTLLPGLNYSPKLSLLF